GAVRRSPSDGIAQIDPPVAIGFGGDPHARPRNSHCSEGHGMPGFMMCLHAVALEHEAQASAPRIAFPNDSARARDFSIYAGWRWLGAAPGWRPSIMISGSRGIEMMFRDR